jgi:hypothetical protein
MSALSSVELSCVLCRCHFFIIVSVGMSHNNNKLWKTPSPDGEKWKIFPHISRYPLAADFESPEDLVIVSHLSESQYRQLKPHRSMSDDSEREKTFATDLRNKMTTSSSSKKKKAADNGGSVITGGVNRSVGPCAAMGSMCGHPDLENRRHSCSVCGHFLHIIAPCCSRFDLNNDVQVCGKCEYNADKEVLNFTDDDDDEVAVVKKKVPPASRDMLATEDTDEDEDDDEEEEAFKTPRVVNKKHSAVASAVAAMPPLGGGTGSAANVRRRSPNFSEVEDAYITKAWCSATEDSRKGSGQKAQDFNKNLYSKFVSLADDYNGQVTKQFQIPMKARTQKAIVDRFAKIKRATSHFAGVVSRNKIKSGEDKETHMRRCLLVYDQTHKGKFTWLECYEILEHLPKWNAQNDAGDSKPVAASVSSQGTKRKNRSRSTGRDKRLCQTRLIGCLTNTMQVDPLLPAVTGCLLSVVH